MSGHGFSRLIPPIPGSSQFSNRLALLTNVEIRQRFQKLLFPEGLSYTKEKGYGTGVSSSLYELLGQIGTDMSDMAPPRGVEPLFPG
jgi:hypothetical protein